MKVAAWVTLTAKVATWLSLVVLWVTLAAEVNAAAGLKFVESADGHRSLYTRELVQWTHSRLVFSKPLERVAVGQDATLQVEVLTSTEVLALAKTVGRTSIMVWYEDGTTESHVFSVVQDLSVLKSALRDIHPAVKLTLAPDRAALVLRGRVPDDSFRMAAESAARHYLGAGIAGGSNNSPLIGGGQLSQLQSSAAFSLESLAQSGPLMVARDTAAVINLIQVDQLPLTMSEKVKATIDPLGGRDVQVQRIQSGSLPNDSTDTLLLSGYVETQVDLVRVLSLAARLFTGEPNDIRAGETLIALANESGGLIDNGAVNVGLGGSSGGFSGLGGTTNGSAMQNNVASNIGRARLVSAAGGRLMSTIEVRDLPQVRVAVQMYEVSRRQLRQWRPDFSVLTQGYDATQGLFGLGGANSRAAGADQVENALQVLGGALVNNLQVGGDDLAFDLLFSLMEQEGISRTMARPNLTVLAGESAVFRAGGEVPVPSAFAPSGIASGDQVGANTSGVFSGTEFKSFGVELAVRAMVDERDIITLDLNPTISLPDSLLTQEIAGTTGSPLNTSAFNVRSLQTTTRLRDGQPLIIGGLVSRDITDNRDFVPGISSVPGLGKLAEQTTESDADRELIIIVTPTILREARHDVGLWQFPGTPELLAGLLPKTSN